MNARPRKMTMRAIGWMIPVILAVLAVGALAPVDGADAEGRTRLVVMTDYFKDPDDRQSLIRLLMYANEFEIEGLIATSLAHGDGSVRPDLILKTLDEYGEVLESLRRHERPGHAYPASDSLKRLVKAGAPVARKLVGAGKGFDVPYPAGAKDSRSCAPAEEWIGAGRDTPASRHLIEVVDRDDSRPVWITVWGGAMDLAQALWTVRQERTPEAFQRFVRKIRVRQISWQDTGTVWIWNHVPELFLVLSAGSQRGFYAEGPMELRDERWVETNVRQARGPLGASYPKAGHPGVKEGDTPSFLYLLARGLSDPEHPEWGGWGGRFRPFGHGTRFYVDARDAHPESGDAQRGMQWTVGRWNGAANNAFAARMAWCVSPFAGANHEPIVALNGDRSARVLEREVVAGAQVLLDSTGTTDPDGDSLDYRWWQYREAGTYSGQAAIENSGAERTTLLAPEVTRRETIHIVLSATDRGSPPLTAYRRLVLSVVPAESEAAASASGTGAP